MKSLKTNFLVDTLIFGGVLAALQPRLTGIAIHEWLALSAAATLVLHVALHWDWAMGVTRTFFKNLLHASRFNYILDIALFVVFTVVMTSGLVISKVVMPTLGLQILSSRTWTELHNTSANLALLLMALHFAMHWSWVSRTFQRLFVAPFKRSARLPQGRAQQPAMSTSMKNAKAL